MAKKDRSHLTLVHSQEIRRPTRPPVDWLTVAAWSVPLAFWGGLVWLWLDLVTPDGRR